MNPIKKWMTLLLALAMALALIPCGAVAEGNSALKIGVLSYLNLTEEEYQARETALLTSLKYLEAHGMLELSEPKPEGDEAPSLQIRYYDTTDALLMALQAGEIDAIRVPKSTADYLCGTNDRLVQPTVFNFPESDAFVQLLLNRISDGYAFMMLEANTDLRDQFNQAIVDMKADGTLDALVLKHIAETSRTGEVEAIAFEQFEGEPIRVAVTGALPPMDYVAPDGSFAGFNTAILAEIGRRLQKNIALMQVDSVGRALALAEGTVDVVFWTRGASEGSLERRKSMTEEEKSADIEQKMAKSTEEQRVVMQSLSKSLDKEKLGHRDMPEGTVCTDPYYTDYQVLVIMKYSDAGTALCHAIPPRYAVVREGMALLCRFAEGCGISGL